MVRIYVVVWSLHCFLFCCILIAVAVIWPTEQNSLCRHCVWKFKIVVQTVCMISEFVSSFLLVKAIELIVGRHLNPDCNQCNQRKIFWISSEYFNYVSSRVHENRGFQKKWKDEEQMFTLMFSFLFCWSPLEAWHLLDNLKPQGLRGSDSENGL